MSNRILDAAKQALSLEGLVGALIGGGVWIIAAAVFTQIPEFGLAAAIAAGAGVGLLAVAAFIWLALMPKRAQEQHRVNVLKGSARQHLVALEAEGKRKWTGARSMEGLEGWIEWQRRVHSFLLDAFGTEIADEFDAHSDVRSQLQMLHELNRNLDDLKLRPGHAGWGGDS